MGRKEKFPARFYEDMFLIQGVNWRPGNGKTGRKN